MLVDQRPDWTSRNSFASILLKVDEANISDRAEVLPHILARWEVCGSPSNGGGVVLVSVIPGRWGAETIKVYLGAVHFLHIAEGCPNPFLVSRHRLHYMLQKIKRSEVERGGRDSPSLLISSV